MVIAATIVMLITMTFWTPYGAYASLYALTISRESPQTTGTAVKSIVAAFVLGGAYVLISALFFFGDPLPRLLWVIASLFASFYVISTMTNYAAAARFGYLIIITIPLWDQQIPTELRVEGTLWAVWAITIASVVAAVGALVFAAMRPGDELVDSIAERLASVEELLTCYAAGRPVDDKAEKRVTRLAMLGTPGYAATYGVPPTRGNTVNRWAPLWCSPADLRTSPPTSHSSEFSLPEKTGSA